MVRKLRKVFQRDPPLFFDIYLMRNWLNKPLPFLSPHAQIQRNAKQIIKRVCHAYTGCIVVGAGDGEVIDTILKSAPHNVHYVFEPQEQRYRELTEHYSKKAVVKLHYLTLGNETAQGDRKDTLDNALPPNAKANLIYIDPSLDALTILLGAAHTLQKQQPYIFFNIQAPHEAGALYDVLNAAGLQLATAEGWMDGKPPLDKAMLKMSTAGSKGGYVAYKPK